MTLNLQDLIRDLPVAASEQEVESLARQTVDNTMLSMGAVAEIAEVNGVQCIPRNEDGEISWQQLMKSLKHQCMTFARQRQDCIDSLIAEIEDALEARQQIVQHIAQLAAGEIRDAEQDGILIDAESAILMAHHSTVELEAVREKIEDLLE